jgi:16S rRNA (cytosine1402-N4)-methyltransferase
MSSFEHISVLLKEVVDAVAPRAGDIIVDCTLGGGGHSEALLAAADCRVIGLDRDPAAIAAASARLSRFGDRFQAVRAKFSEVGDVLDRLHLATVDGFLADLGVSSPQLDTAERGFSFRAKGPVDMRMNPDDPISAADVVNSFPEDEISDILLRYGEERRARRVARLIVHGRPWTDTLTLAEAVAEAVGRKPGGSKIHPATRTFQAIRIFVNDELGELQQFLPAALERLSPGGRLSVITFHSLEDRIVKQFFALEAGRSSPKDPYGHPLYPPRLSLQKPVSPSTDDPNRRARSARLRTAVRLPWNA